MDSTNESTLTIKIIEYSLNKDSLTIDELTKDLNLSKLDVTFVKANMIATHDNNSNPSHILGAIFAPRRIGGEIDYTKSTFRLLPSAYFSFVDHLEVVEARRNAEFAKENSIIANTHALKAVNISRWSLVAAIVLGIVQIVLQLIVSN